MFILKVTQFKSANITLIISAQWRENLPPVLLWSAEKSNPVSDVPSFLPNSTSKQLKADNLANFEFSKLQKLSHLAKLVSFIVHTLTEMEGALKLLQKELFVCSLAAPFELFSGCKKYEAS